MKIGILGGTFDPVHLGHLHLAKKVCQKLRLSKIIFIPTYLPPHKKSIKITPAKHRYNMLKLAIKGYRKFTASDIETKRKGRSYSVITLRQLRKKYGPKAELFFITGSDSLKELDKWKNLNEILKLSNFVIVKRPHFEFKNIPEGFIVVDIKAKDISATEIREKIRMGASIVHIIPKGVREYIDKHRLYLTIRALQKL